MQALLASKGGIEAVVTAMTSHRAVVAVQYQGCFALACICEFDINQASDVFLGIFFFCHST
jgi:hypothetical protein